MLTTHMRELGLALRRKHKQRPEVSVETLALLVAIVLASVANGPFWHAALAGRSFADSTTWCFAAATLIALIAGNFIAIGIVATRHIVRPLAAILIVVSMCAAHYMQRYGIVLDAAMLRNVLHTDLREASEFVGAGGALGVGLAAAGLLWTVRLRKRPIKSALLVRMAALTVCAIVGLAALATVFQDFSSTMRNVRSLRYTISPGNIVWGLGQVLAADAHAIASVREASEPAYRTSLAATARKPVLLVIVVGETARAANFSLNGYARATNPELARLDVINFSRATACGTSTEVSLPCMFSPFGRADYDAQRIRRHESLLHVLAHTGMRVVWLDNQSGCKGVCDGLDFRDLSRASAARLCAEGRCYDEILLQELAQLTQSAAQDTVVVLHQLGNHGPAYFRRYPPEMKRFEPACESMELRDCTREQIVNAYDNAIAYTDHFLAQIVRHLDGLQGRFDAALLYVSDHGESLGELGLYLHGMPYAIAPKEQLEVPLIWWVPRESAQTLGVDRTCFRRKSGNAASHDNLFHSVLGLLAVNTPHYKAERDLFDGCYTTNPRGNSTFAANQGSQQP